MLRPTATAGHATALAVMSAPAGVHALSLGDVWSVPSGLAHGAWDVTRDRVVPTLSILFGRSWSYPASEEPKSEAAATQDATWQADLLRALEDEALGLKYPEYPHAPLLVAVATCSDVALRWKSFNDGLWPVERFIVQRYPDDHGRNQWITIVNASLDSIMVVDERVQSGGHYIYRAQVVASNASSPFTYDAVNLDLPSSSHHMGRAIASFLPLGLHEYDSSDVARVLLLFGAFFLTIYGVIRVNALRLQRTQARNTRLKRIHKSTSESAQSSKITYRSSASVSSLASSRENSSESSVHSELSGSSKLTNVHEFRSDSLEPVTTDTPAAAARARTPSPTTRHSAPAGTGLERALRCQSCRKRFGIFRRRHVCDMCHNVALCRKCGYQSPVDGFHRSTAAVSHNNRQSLANDGSPSSRSVRNSKKKVRTICRDCCEEVYRYSTVFLRPSYQTPTNPVSLAHD